MSSKAPLLTARLPLGSRLLLALKNPDFRPLWGSALMNYLGSTMSALVLGWYVLETTGSPWNLAQFVFYQGVAQLFLSPFAGALSDRFPRKSLLVVGGTIKFLPLLFLTSLMYSGQIQLWHIYVASGIASLGRMVDLTTYRVATHDIVGDEGIINAMSLDSFGRHASRGLGPLMGGVLYDVAGPHIAVTAVTAAQLGSLLLLIPVRLQRRTSGPQKATSIFGDTLRGLAYVSRNKMILGIVMGAMVTNFFLLPMLSMMPTFARDVLHISATKLGVMTAVGTLGSVSGALFMVSRGTISRPALFWLGFAYSLAVATILFSLSRWFTLSTFILVVHGFIFAPMGVIQPSLVASGAMSFSMSLGPMGALVMGSLITSLGPSAGLAVSAGIAILLLTLVASLSPGFLRGSFKPTSVATT
ncbi:MAG: MFS transporter [Chloroflexi bacterium]|nr:MFS transporter [Chloroflexota bacterium]